MAEAPLIRAQRYHDHAKALLRIARQEENRIAKDKLLALSTDYEALSKNILRSRLRRQKSKL
jgi:hypothetical protein